MKLPELIDGVCPVPSKSWEMLLCPHLSCQRREWVTFLTHRTFGVQKRKEQLCKSWYLEKSDVYLFHNINWLSLNGETSWAKNFYIICQFFLRILYSQCQMSVLNKKAIFLTACETFLGWMYCKLMWPQLSSCIRPSHGILTTCSGAGGDHWLKITYATF